MKHTQVPNKMAEDGLTPREQLVYAVLHSYNNPVNGCFPSLEKISQRSKLSIPTIRKSLKRLEETEYIKVEKRGRKNYYLFNKYIEFEPFSQEFLDNQNITPTTKAYLIAAQQLMFKDVEGIGKISYSVNSLADKINMPESSIRRCNKELENKNYLTTITNKSRDLETGCNTNTKIFNLKELGQSIIWVLKNHEDRLDKLEREMKEKDILIEKLLKERNKPNVILT